MRTALPWLCPPGVPNTHSSPRVHSRSASLQPCNPAQPCHPPTHPPPAHPQVLKAKGGGVVSSVFFMCLPDRVLVYGDCAVNVHPEAEELAGIAITSADTAKVGTGGGVGGSRQADLQPYSEDGWCLDDHLATSRVRHAGTGLQHHRTQT